MAKDITKTPVKLYAQVARGLMIKFRTLIDDHGLTFAVNSALADHLRSLGVSIAVLETPTDKMKKAQGRRWRAVKAEKKVEAQKEARRAKRSAEQQTRSSEDDPNAGEMVAPVNPYNKEAVKL